MKAKFIILAMLVFSTDALAQGAPSKPKGPTVGAKPLLQVKPAAPTGCKLVETVKGTKLWAGDCVASDQLRSSVTYSTLLDLGRLATSPQAFAGCSRPHHRPKAPALVRQTFG